MAKKPKKKRATQSPAARARERKAELRKKRVAHDRNMNAYVRSLESLVPERKRLTAHECFMFGQVSNRVEYSAQMALRAVSRNGVDVEGAAYGLRNTAGEAARLSMILPGTKDAEEALSVATFARTLEREITRNGKITKRDQASLKKQTRRLRDKAEELATRGESACPL